MPKFKTINEAIEETLAYVKGRQTGAISSLRTGYPKLDKAMIDGMELNSTISLGGRPSVGKSAVSDCLVEGCFVNNVDKGTGLPTFDLLDMNWELSARVTLLRRLSARMKKTYKYILSADNNTLSDREYQEIEDILKKGYGKLPITFCEEPLSTGEFADTVKRHIDKTKRNTLVRIDHTLLAKMTASEGGQVQMLLNLLMKANEIKKQYPVIFLFINQINRDFEDRQEDGTDGAYPRQGDVYGGDAAAMFSETIILLNKPSKYGISYYGRRPDGRNVETNDLYFHVVKNRNSDPDLILHYKEDFANMSIKEY